VRESVTSRVKSLGIFLLQVAEIWRIKLSFRVLLISSF
jgi:hypothetical protein